MASIRILIVDDHYAVRLGLRHVLSSRSDWAICGEAADGIEAVEKTKSLQPDIVLMDISMPRMNGMEATRTILKEFPQCKVVIITQNDPSVARNQAAAVGAKAFVTKAQLSRDLLTTVEQVAQNGDSELNRPVQANTTARADDLPPGGGVVGQLVRDLDWSKKPLGPIHAWPRSLKTVLRVLLTSRFAMWMGWGPDLTFFYNDAYARMTLGKKHPWALGRSSREVWAEIWDDIGPRIQRVLESGEATWDEALLLFLERSGYREETYHTFSYSPLAGDDGKVAGHLCVVTEETDRVIGERRLKTLRSLATELNETITEDQVCASIARSLSENQKDLPFSLTYLFTSDGKQAYLACRTGIEQGHPAAPDLLTVKVSGERWPLSEILNGKSAFVVEELSKRFESVPSGFWDASPTKALLVPITSQGQDKPAGFFVAALNPYRQLDAGYKGFIDLVAGQIAASIANARAYDEERKRAQALAEIDRAKTLFFSNVSHEFRTPLTLMLGPLQDLLARSQTHLSPTAKEQLELANRNGARLLRLVNTLLDFSRIEAGRAHAVFQATDVAEFTTELASVFRSATERGGVRLVVNCKPPKEPAYVDRDMWEKIVLNLVSNAFKFTFKGEIKVSLKQVGHAAELQVRDTGVGIPSEEIPRLFDRFHRVPNTRSRTHEGSGIGLALVHELVKLHGGAMRVESVLGQGSTFIVSIPLGQDHLTAGQIGGDRPLSSTATGAAPFVEEALRWLPESGQMDTSREIAPDYELMAVPARPFSQGASRSRVLIADDNADMRLYLMRLLSERFEVQAVANGQAALEAIGLRAPDLVLSDAMMPELDGFGLLRELRSRPETRTVPFILLSAMAGEESRVEGLDAGADDYLVKPFSARELIARVQTHLQLAQVRQEAEKAIRESENKLQLSLRASNMGVFYWYPEEDRTEADARVLEIFGLSSTIHLTLAEALARMIHPDDRNRYAEGVKRSLEPNGDGKLQEEIRISLEDGQERWISVTAQVRSTPGHETRRMAGLIGDITDRKQVEDAVRQRSAQYETLLNRAPLGVYTIDDKFHIRDVNPTALPVFGNIPDLIGRDLNEVMHILWTSDHADEVVRIFRHTLETGEPYQTNESIHHRRDRAVKEFYEWRIDRIPLPEGGYGVVCYFRDISRFVHARQTIADSQERLRLATEAAELGIWHWHLDEDRVTWENDRPYEIFDRRREDGAIEAAEFRAKIIHPEDAQAFERAVAEMLQTAAPLFFQGRINRKDGSVVWIELTGRLELRADGSPWRVLGTVLDISLRKQTEELMHQHRNRFDMVAKTAQVGFWFCDLPFDKLSWDKIVKEHFWLPPDAEVTIETFYERLHPDDRERTRQAIAESNAKDLPYDIEFRTVSPDGLHKWIRATGRTFYDPAGEPKRFDGLTLDITERKRADLELRESEARFRDLSETLEAEVGVRTSELAQRNVDILRQSEEVRDLSWRLMRTQDDERRHIARELHDSAGQTLTVLGMSLARLVTDTKQKAPEVAKQAEETQRLVQHLNQEIRTTSYLLHPPLLDESGLSAALDLYVRGLAERSGLSVELSISELFGRLPSDLELAVFRIVQECLTNIHRHSESETAVIRLARQPDSISVEVQDQGKGMTADRLAEIQLGGSGIGIRGIRERLHQFKGQMNIESDNSGTRILVTIPIPKDMTFMAHSKIEPLQAEG